MEGEPREERLRERDTEGLRRIERVDKESNRKDRDRVDRARESQRERQKERDREIKDCLSYDAMSGLAGPETINKYTVRLY